MDVLCVRWMVWNGTSVSTARRNSRSRVTSCDMCAYTLMKSRSSVVTASGHLPSRARWLHMPKHILVLKSTNAKSVRSCSAHRAASKSISGYIPVSIVIITWVAYWTCSPHYWCYSLYMFGIILLLIACCDGDCHLRCLQHDALHVGVVCAVAVVSVLHLWTESEWLNISLNCFHYLVISNHSILSPNIRRS